METTIGFPMLPRYFSWLFIATLAYLVYAVSPARGPQNTTPNTAPSEAEATATRFPTLTAATDLERWRRAINPDYAATHDCTSPPIDAKRLPMNIIDLQPGGGEGAACGSTIQIGLTLWDSTGSMRYEGSLALPLGEHAVAAGLDAALMGLKPGGERLIVLPPEAQQRMAKSHAPAALLAALPTGKAAKLVIVKVKRLEDSAN